MGITTRIAAMRCFASCGMLLTGCAPSYDAVLPEPKQEATTDPGEVLDAAGRIRGLAAFESTTLVLKKTQYDVDLDQDPMSEFAPEDMVMAWGRAGLKASRDGVSIAQGRRRYAWTAGGVAWSQPDVKRFGQETANWHLVPANDEVAGRIADVDVGDVVEIKGELVSLALKNGTIARSSLTRDDDGDGACEIVRVVSIRKVS